MRARLLIIAIAVTALTACPLPFEFVPENTTGSVAASSDPANPSITAAPVIEARQTTTDASIPDSDSTDAAVYQFSTVRDVSVRLASATPGATIFYTINGSEPEPGSESTKRYSAGDTIEFAGNGANETVHAIAIGPGMYPSLAAVASVSINYQQLDRPIFSPAPGAYNSDQSVTIRWPDGSANGLAYGDWPDGARVYYRVQAGTDAGAAPTVGGPDTFEYNGTPIPVANPGTQLTISAIAVQSERLDSSVATGTYLIDVTLAAPTGVAATTSEPDAVTISWNAVADATGYEIWRTDSDGSSDTQLGTIATGTSFTDSSAVVNVAYSYRVRALFGSAPGPFSSSVTGRRNLLDTIWYIRGSTGEPWGGTEDHANPATMDRAFGAGNWQLGEFGTVDPSTVFVAGSLVFLDGSTGSTGELLVFLRNNQTQIESWLIGGGRLFVNSALGSPISFTIGSVTYTTADGTDYITEAEFIDSGHPIRQGALATYSRYSGSSFTHGTVSASTPGALTTIIGNFDASDPAASAALAETTYGSGTMLFGSMTLPMFHWSTEAGETGNPITDPTGTTDSGKNLRAAILRYLASQ